MSIDNQVVEVMEGDFLLTALMLHPGYARISNFSNSPRAGFCMMGACQDCCATAFFLRQRGLSVILLEQYQVGQQASGVNCGNVRRQGRFLPQLPLANRSREIWGRIPELTGSDVEFMKVGHVRFVWDEAQFEVIETYAKGALEYDFKLEIIGKNVIGAQLKQLMRLVPALRHANIIRSWSGIESYLPDELPVMGPSSRHDGLFYAFGFCGHGFQTGPGVGDMMAELIATGETSIAIDHYSIRRFSDLIDGKAAPP